jgi:hypothetical protein
MIPWFHLSLQSRKAQRRQTQITPSTQLNPSSSSLSTFCRCPTRSSSYKILGTFRREARNKIPSTGSRGGLVTTNMSGLKGKPKDNPPVFTLIQLFSLGAHKSFVPRSWFRAYRCRTFDFPVPRFSTLHMLVYRSSTIFGTAISHVSMAR